MDGTVHLHLSRVKSQLVDNQMISLDFLPKCCRNFGLLMELTESTSGLDLVVCACGEQQYTARDAIDLAMFRNQLHDKWKRFLRDVAAEERADELDLDLDETAIAAAAEAFRYEHDLITAEETEAWLANRGLTFDEFSDYFTRRYYASAVDENVIAEEVEYDSASPELRQSFVEELILSGEFDRIATDLIWRVAARCAEPNPAANAISAEEGRFFQHSKVKAGQLPDWLNKIGRNSKWFGEMTAMEAAYRRCCERILVPQARQRELTALQLLLTTLETEVIEIKSRDAAQEALFCVREDGMSMEQVAAEGPYPYRRDTFFLEDIPVDAQQRFVSVSAGDILGPLARPDGFEVCRVINKIEPQADDPNVQSRIDQRLLERHFSELARRHVQRRLGGTLA
jgi:hypothetical protein